MGGVLALLASIAAFGSPQLPPLPTRGLVRETDAGVELQTMRGRRIHVLRGFNLAPDRAISRDLLLRDRRGWVYELDRRARRLRLVSNQVRPLPRCRVTDRRARLQLVVCKSVVKIRRADGMLAIAARAPGRIGHWERAAFAPRGDAFFAQWSAECEVPVAFYVADGKMRPFGAGTFAAAPESIALGWLPDGRAVIHFPKGACGKSQGAPGVYAVPVRGMVTLLVRTTRFEQYWMWGG